jgi:hypothetical protein
MDDETRAALDRIEKRLGKRKEGIVKYRELTGANAEKAIATVDRL